MEVTVSAEFTKQEVELISILDDIIGKLSKLFAGVAFIAMVLMAVHISGSVLLRFVTGHGIPVTIEVAQYYYMVCLTYLPLALIEKQGKHLNAEFLYAMFPPVGQRALDFLTQALLLPYIGFMAWRSYLNAADRMAADERITTTAGYFMTWPARWIVPVSLSLVFVYVVLKMVRTVLPTDGQINSNVAGS